MNNDVTAGYIINDVERSREPMQKITRYLLKSFGLKPSEEIITVAKKKRTGQNIVTLDV